MIPKEWYRMVLGTLPSQTLSPSSQGTPQWLDQVLQVMALNNPDYSRLAPANLPTAPQNILSAAASPGSARGLAATQLGGTGPTITAAPHATVPATPAPAATAAPAGLPPASAGARGGMQSQAGAPTPAVPAQAAAPPPALNPATLNAVWDMMRGGSAADRGVRGGGGDIGVEAAHGEPGAFGHAYG